VIFLLEVKPFAVHSSPYLEPSHSSSDFAAFTRQPTKHIGVVTAQADLAYNRASERRCCVITNFFKTLLTAQFDAAGSSYTLAPI